jgi:hypothetical protein
MYRPLRVKWELRPSHDDHHALTCVFVEPPKGGNIVLCRDRSPRASVGKSGFGNGPAIDLKCVGLIEHALDVRASLLFSVRPLNSIHCLSHLSDH